ncbi:cytochrome P450 2J2 [Ixodes scapularis]
MEPTVDLSLIAPKRDGAALQAAEASTSEEGTDSRQAGSHGQVNEDVFLNGYLIPKGTIVVANVWAAHFDPKYWKNPEEFDPSRFLTPDESALLPRPEHLIPFSIGKRMCPGGALATAEIFLCVTTLLQTFRVLPEDGASFSVASDQLADLLTQGLCFVPRIPE